MWLGPEATVHVMRGLQDQLDAELSAVSATTARASFIPGKDSGARACPTCGVVMARIAITDVIVDSCSAHGAWFDRGEIECVVAACTKLHDRQRREDGQEITVAGLAEGVGMIVTSTVSVAWAALVSLLTEDGRGGD